MTPQELEQILAQDPVVQQFYNSPNRSIFGSGQGSMSELSHYLQQKYGAQLPKDYQFNLGKDTANLDHQNWFERNMDWLIPSLLVGGVVGPAALTGTGVFGGGGGAAAGAGGSSAAAGASSAAPVALNAAPTIPTVGFEGLGPTVSPFAGHAATAASGRVGSYLSKFGEGLKDFGKRVISGDPQTLADLGSTLGAFSEGEANNRVSRGNLTQRYDQLMLNAADNRRQDTTDALKKLSVTGYLQSGGRPYNAAAAGLPSYGFGPVATTQAQRQGAATLEQELLKRLEPGGSYTPTPLDSYANRGAAENITNWAGLVLGGLGAGSNPYQVPGAPQYPQAPQPRVGTPPYR